MKDYGDEKVILDLISDTRLQFRRKRLSFERVFFRNILFNLGNQWIRWDDSFSGWRRRKLKNWVPTPVTNRYSSTAERLISVLSRIEPNWEFVPASDSEEDMAAASLADQIEDIICEEIGIEQIREDISRWLVHTGNAFVFSWAEEVIDMKQRAQLALPDEEELMEMPEEVRAQLIQEHQQQAQMSEEMAGPPEYKLFSDVLSPFEVLADLSTPGIPGQQKMILQSRKDKEYVNNMYGIEVDESKLDKEDLGLHYLERIGYMTEDFGRSEYQTGADNAVPRTTVLRILHAPCEDWPEGLYAVKAGDKLLESQGWPTTPDGKPFNPMTQFKFDGIPGAFFGKTPMSDIVPKQVQRNKMEANLELGITRMSNPIWLVHQGTIMNGLSGEPGALVKYRLMGDKATRPDRIPGEQIPSSVPEFIMMIDNDIEELAATFEAMKGKAPYSGVPGVVVDQLVEQGMNRFGPALRNIGEGYRGIMKNHMELFRRYATTPRIRAIKGENQQWKISKFSNADFKGAVNVRIETDSTVPRSEQVEASRTMVAIDKQLVDLSDPITRRTVLKKLKLSQLVEPIDNDILAAVREHEAIQAGQPIQVTQFIDNHQIHIDKHRSWANTEEGRPFLQVLVVHITEHHMIMDAEMNPGMVLPAGVGGPKGGQPNLTGMDGGKAPQPTQQIPPQQQGQNVA